MNWFDEFTRGLRGEKVSLALRGAGTADATRAMAHYRFQHEAKYREAVEDHFPVTRRLLGEGWERCWRAFWQAGPGSPRSLDFVAQVFLDQVSARGEVDARLKELMRFEQRLELLPWHLLELAPAPWGGWDESTTLQLAPHEVHVFAHPVSRSYQEEALATGPGETLILWLSGAQVRYRVMAPWELAVLRALPQGLEAALEQAPEDADEVSAFFQWLGGSGLVRPNPGSG